jgi:hypothetical protein
MHRDERAPSTDIVLGSGLGSVTGGVYSSRMFGA